MTKDDIEMKTESVQGEKPSRRSFLSEKYTFLLKAVLPIVITAAAFTGAAVIIKTRPEARKKTPVKTVPLVQVQAVQPGCENVVIHAMGSVIPARQIVLKSRVAGEVVETHPDFMEGGILQVGEQVLRIDSEDYRLAVARKKSNVVNAEYQLKLEMGHQDIARREWQLLKGEEPAKALDLELALRKPHLAKARADFAAAEAELKQARLDLGRTRICAPFNAVIRSKSVEIGSQIAIQEQLAELVGTDEYWILTSIPTDRLQWIGIPRNGEQGGSRAVIVNGNSLIRDHRRSGVVIRLLSDLETEGRMARILISVKDPLNLSQGKNSSRPLLIGEYVSVEIQGHAVEDVYRIPRSALRDNQNVWIAEPDGTLTIRNVETVWRGPQTVLVKKGLRKGERLIVSDLAAPVNGMTVCIESFKEESSVRCLSEKTSALKVKKDA